MLILFIIVWGLAIGWIAQFIVFGAGRPTALALFAGLAGSFVGGLLSEKFPNHAPLLFLISELGIGLFGLLLLDRFLERDRLLRLEHRLGHPLVAAFDADDRIVLAEIVKAGGAFGAGPLGAPFRIHHG